MKPTDLKKVLDKLRGLGFEVTAVPGPVDRANHPMSIDISVKSRSLSMEEREAFGKFLADKRG